MPHGKPFDINDYNVGTAYCAVHGITEPFKVTGEPKVPAEVKTSLEAHNGKIVTVQLLCENKQQIVTAL